jgi:glycosyltransferase involved in cell wall biosynthesis
MYEKGAIDGSVLSGYDTVLFMGSYRRSNMPHLLSLVDCVICPSINESYGLVSRECEMLGVPYIATHTGGQTNGSIPPNDPAALAVAIQEVIDA